MQPQPQPQSQPRPLEDAVVRKLMTAFVDTFGLVSHHVESYQNFLNYQIREIVSENTPIRVSAPRHEVVHVIHMADVHISDPVMTEHDGFVCPLTIKEAMLRRQTYMFDVIVNLQHDTYAADGAGSKRYVLKTSKHFENVLLFKVPAMRMSDSDPDFRLAGSFVINGYEKTLISQEKVKTNAAFGSLVKRTGKKLWRVELRAHHAQKLRSTSTVNLYMAVGSVAAEVAVPFINKPLPLLVTLQLLDTKQSLKQLLLLPDSSPAMRELVDKVCGHFTDTQGFSESEVFDFVGEQSSSEKLRRKRIMYVRHVVTNELFPHCQTTQDKVFCLGMCARKLLGLSLGEVPHNDPDDYVNKRVSTAGTLLALLTRQHFRSFVKSVQGQIFKAVNNNKHVNLIDFFNHRKITQGLKFAFSTGNWGINKGSAHSTTSASHQSGVCQVLASTNKLGRLSHLRLVNTPVNRDGKSVLPRQLHMSHKGLLCAAETPEGRTTGLLNTLAMFARVRTGCPTSLIMPILLEDFGVQRNGDMTGSMVMVNGVVAGWSAVPKDAFLHQYRQYRQWHSVPADSSAVVLDGVIVINTDADDVYRPMLSNEHLHKLPQLLRLYGEWPMHLWHRLVVEGVVQYINKEEENYRAAELQSLHASTVLYGVSASTINFSNHNQAPRNIYAGAMMKQALSSHPLQDLRVDNKCFSLDYAQRSVVTTWAAEAVDLEETPAGQNVVIGVLSYGGFNQEDSLIFNKASLERGLFRTTVFRHYRDSEMSIGTDCERFEAVKGVDDDGLVKVGTSVDKGTVLIGKTVEYTHIRKGRTKRDNSTTSSCEEPSRVSRVIMTITKEGMRCATVRTCNTRIPEVGDKFASKNGQKGVVGIILPQENMPFTEKDGIVPDVLINPHAIPSRMTIGHLLEALMGKVACVAGSIVDGTPHRGSSQQLIAAAEKAGVMHMGKERMICGKTGERLKMPVNVGVMYYQRLHHMVADKLHARGTGPKQVMTRQPVEGRSRNGGLRIGEMERDALIAHGVSSVLMDRMLLSSDKFDVNICAKCGIMAEKKAPKEEEESNLLHRKAYCRYCDSHEHVVDVVVPYAFKLLAQELEACHVRVKYTIKKSGV